MANLIFSETERKAHQDVLFWAKRLTYCSADKHPEWKLKYEEAKKRLEEIKKKELR